VSWPTTRRSPSSRTGPSPRPVIAARLALLTMLWTNPSPVQAARVAERTDTAGIGADPGSWPQGGAPPLASTGWLSPPYSLHNIPYLQKSIRPQGLEHSPLKSGCARSPDTAGIRKAWRIRLPFSLSWMSHRMSTDFIAYPSVPPPWMAWADCSTVPMGIA
jgi:hypothetical protein